MSAQTTPRDRAARVGASLSLPAVYVLVTIAIVAFGSPFSAQLSLNLTVFALLALSLHIIVGMLGEVSFGHGAFLGSAGYVLAIAMDRFDYSFGLAAVLAVLAVGAFAAVFGCVGARIHHVQFAMLTFAMNGAAVIVASNARGVTNGEIGITVGRPDWLTSSSLPIIGAVAFGVCYFAISVLRRSTWGRTAAAVRENEPLSESLGVKPWKYRHALITLSGVFAAVAGVLFSANLRIVGPSSVGFYYSSVGLLLVVVGGRSHPAGAVIGAAFFVALPELLRETSSTVQIAIFATVLILSIKYLPLGLHGVWQNLTGRVRASAARPQRLVN